ncbi:Protein of unknown function [Gryllus bimaculatus]|nr:Protein of unknown function [Gryllus bimaculatus]
MPGPGGGSLISIASAALEIETRLTVEVVSLLQLGSALSALHRERGFPVTGRVTALFISPTRAGQWGVIVGAGPHGLRPLYKHVCVCVCVCVCEGRGR